MSATTDPSPHSGHLPGSPGYRRVVISLFLAGVATFMALYSTQALLPAIAIGFAIPTSAAALSVSVTTLGLGAALLVAGPLSDVVGRTRLIHLSLGLTAIVGLACALAPTWPALLVLRLLEGVVLAGLPAVATAYLREELHASTHARVTGLYVGGTALGGMAGRLVTGAIGEAAGWRWALAASAVLGVGCAVGVRLLLPASRRFVPSPRRASELATRTRRALSDPALITLYAVGATAAGVQLAVFNTVGFRLQAAPFGLGLAAASLVFLVYPVGTISSTVSGGLADRWGRRAVLPVGGLVGIVGVLLTLSDDIAILVVGLALLVAGFFATHGVASGWVPARAHAGGVATGQAASIYLAVYYLGASVFGGLGGWAWRAGAWPGVVALACVLLVVTDVLALSLRRTPILVPAS